MHNGSLTYNDYKRLFNSKIIFSNHFKLNQLQPSSIDLTLSDECYEISSSFLSPNEKVRIKLNNTVLIPKIIITAEVCFDKLKVFPE